MSDPYEALGVSAGATEAEVRAAYRRLVRQYHPDRFATCSPEERARAEGYLRAVLEAYQCIREKGSSGHANGGTQASRVWAAPTAPTSTAPPPKKARAGAVGGGVSSEDASSPGCLHPPRWLVVSVLSGLALLVAGLAALASRSTGPPPAPKEALVVVEERTYDVERLVLAAQTTVVIHLLNRDVGYQHNLSVYETRGDGTEGRRVFQGRTVTGPAGVSYVLPTPAVGTYAFRCDVFPSMRGVLLLR